MALLTNLSPMPPSIPSKKADLSRGLAKNLGSASRPSKRPRPPGQLLPTTGTGLSPVLTKYPYKKWASLSGLQTRSKRMGAFIDKWREITSDPEILNIVLVSKIPLRCKPVQNAHLMDVELESPCKSRHSTSLPHKRGLFPLSIPSPQKGWSLSACKMPGFPKNVRGEHFQTKNISLLKFLLQRGDFMNILDIKAHTCRSRPQGL